MDWHKETQRKEDYSIAVCITLQRAVLQATASLRPTMDEMQLQMTDTDSFSPWSFSSQSSDITIDPSQMSSQSFAQHLLRDEIFCSTDLNHTRPVLGTHILLCVLRAHPNDSELLVSDNPNPVLPQLASNTSCTTMRRLLKRYYQMLWSRQGSLMLEYSEDFLHFEHRGCICCISRTSLERVLGRHRAESQLLCTPAVPRDRSAPYRCMQSPEGCIAYALRQDPRSAARRQQPPLSA
jgi:hypothetical protein